MFHFTSIQKGILWGLFNLRIFLILISLLPPLQFSRTLDFFASSLGFLSKNRIPSAVVIGLVSSLRYRLLHTQRLVSSTSFLIYAIISLSTKRNRLVFCIALLVVQRIGCTLLAVAPNDPHYWGFFTFCLHPSHRVRTQVLQNPLSNTDCSNLLSNVWQGS